ncbi:MAG: acyl-CoA dehydrogenase, partial [Rhodobacteraceae bacterium]|nr:acyl-CoA dehydrogenase [Paracoccaceae bacterium]
LNDRFAGAVPYQRGFARILGAHAHLKAALADPSREPLARVMIRRILPEHLALFVAAREGAAGLYALGLGELAA